MITPETLTDEMIMAARADAADECGDAWVSLYKETSIALHDESYAADYPTSTRRMQARRRICEYLNARSS